MGTDKGSPVTQDIVTQHTCLPSRLARVLAQEARVVAKRRALVLWTMQKLAATKKHKLTDRQREVEFDFGSPWSLRLRPRKNARTLRLATGAEGLAIIDAKRDLYRRITFMAIRAAYIGAGYRVVALAPTTSGCEDLKRDGLVQSSTVQQEIFALNTDRVRWDSSTIVMVDEAQMLKGDLAAMLLGWTLHASAKLILLGEHRLARKDGAFRTLKEQCGAGSPGADD